MKHRLIAFVETRDEINSFIKRYRQCNFVFVALEKFTDDVLLIDTKNMQNTILALFSLHQKNPFCGIINPKERFVIIASKAALELGLPPIIADPYLVRDKYRMVKTLSFHLNCAKTTLIKTPNDIFNTADLTFPGVLKPRHGVNSMFAVKIKYKGQLAIEARRQRRMFCRVTERDFHAFDFFNNDFVFETFIEGTEHTVESFVKDSKVMIQILSDKFPMKPPFFIEEGDIMPSGLPAETQKGIFDVVRKAISVLNIQNGWTHTEVKLHEGKIYIIEMAARMGGGYFQQMIEQVYDIDRIETLIDMYIGKPIKKMRPPKKFVIGRRRVAYGINYLLKCTGIKKNTNSDNLLFLYNANSRVKRHFIKGPPYGYDNTIIEYLVIDKTEEGSIKLFNEVEKKLKVYKIRLPSLLYKFF